MRPLIIIGDDLGYSPNRDLGIFEAFERNGLSGSSLLVNGYSSREAAKKAVELGVPLGLHLNLTEGKAIHLNCPSLLNDKGCFKGKFGLRDSITHVSARDVEAEICSQIWEFQKLTGRLPLYVDGHQHCHVLPIIRDVFAEVLPRLGIFRTRMPIENLIYSHWYDTNLKQLAFVKSVIAEATKAKAVFDAHEITYCQSFFGLALTSNLTLERLWSSLMGIPNTTPSCEWMVHPGRRAVNAAGGFLPDFEQDDFALSEDRVNELSILTDEQLKLVLKEEGFYVAPFPSSSSSNSSRDTPGALNKPSCCILSSITPWTGNQSTAIRLRSLFSEWFSMTILSNKITSADFSTYLGCHQTKLVIGIHAYRSGHLLISRQVPYIIILSGTDMNEMINEPEKRMVIVKALSLAKHVVSFNEHLAAKAHVLVPNQRIHIIPQSVIPIQITEYSGKIIETLLKPHHIDLNKRPLLILPLGIRAVKDPLYLLDAIANQYREAQLVIVGPVLEEPLAVEVRKKCLGGNIHYIGPLVRSTLLMLMGCGDVVINCSLHEGMSNTILEALSLNRPVVIARDIEGNRTLIQHKVNGLLFASPTEFVQLCKYILNTEQHDLRQQIVAKGFHLMTNTLEKEMYRPLLAMDESLL